MLQDWLLALVTDTAQVGNEMWMRELLTALVEQLAMYSSEIRDKSFCEIKTVRRTRQRFSPECCSVLVRSRQLFLPSLRSLERGAWPW